MLIKTSDVGIIKKWIEHHWKGEPLCPVCKNNDWTIGRTIVELRPFSKGSLSMGGPLYPAVVFTCNVCGHTLFFNAIRLGIVKFPPTKLTSTPPLPPKEDNGVVTPPKEVIPSKEKEGDDNG